MGPAVKSFSKDKTLSQLSPTETVYVTMIRQGKVGSFVACICWYKVAHFSTSKGHGVSRMVLYGVSGKKIKRELLVVA